MLKSLNMGKILYYYKVFIIYVFSLNYFKKLTVSN